MSDPPAPGSRPIDRPSPPATGSGPDDDPFARVEAYETESGAVIFDAERPTAWIESSAPLRIDEQT